jgi:predicted nucleotide-binding protein (sugar kinase/HSP70/actin superfamily)
VEKIIRLSCFYLDKTFGTEAILSAGKSIEYIQNDFSGIVNTMPFGCMPGTIVSALSTKIREDFDNIPWLNIAYEGLEDTNELTRLEAFIHQAKEYDQKKIKCQKVKLQMNI